LIDKDEDFTPLTISKCFVGKKRLECCIDQASKESTVGEIKKNVERSSSQSYDVSSTKGYMNDG